MKIFPRSVLRVSFEITSCLKSKSRIRTHSIFGTRFRVVADYSVTYVHSR